MNALAIPSQVEGDSAAAGMPADASATLELAKVYVIDCPEMYEAAADELKDITRKIKAANDKRLELTRPIDAAKKALMDFFNAPISVWENAAGLLRNGMLGYQRAEQAKADQARREAEAAAAVERARIQQEQREAEKAAEAARQAGNHEAEAVALAKVEDAQDAIEIAEISAPVVVAMPKTTAKGISTRKNWSAEVHDFNALLLYAADELRKGNAFPASFLMADEKALNTAAKSMQAKLAIPGVRPVVTEALAVRTK